MQDGNGNPSAHDAMHDAVDAARTLLARLAEELDARDGPEALAASRALRETQPVLDRLARTASADAADVPAATGSLLILDVSDLLGYFKHNRLPTGIQRVQAELIYNILSATGAPASQLCCFVETRDVWVSVSSAKFLDICAQSRTGGDALEPRWRTAVDGLRAELEASPALAFPQDAVLVNVGSSWWLPNYFLYVREAKAAYGVRYVPLIYDLIPIITPENCDPELVKEFVGWFIGVLDHADFFFAISEATKRDLIAYAARMGHVIAADRVGVIPLNADFRPPALAGQSKAPRRLDEPYVLFVSTLEARKNQLGAMDAWSALMAKHGPERIPKLVLVGKRGFHSDRVLARLENNQALRERVTILANVDDAGLQALYRDCAFTIYPSIYEGWGLPVTESLCNGKVPVIADNSSLPEAGDRFAVYFETGSTAALVAALERMLFEPGYREANERAIREGFAPVKWADVAKRMTDGLGDWQQQARTPAPLHPRAEPGFYYPLKRNHSSRVWRGSGLAEVYRRGLGWYVVEDHGCWIKPAGAELAMQVSGMRRGRLALQLVCAPRSDIRYRIEVPGIGASIAGRINDGACKWVSLDLDTIPPDGVVVVRLSATVVDQPDLGWNGDFRPLTIGLSGFFLFGDDDRPSRLDFVEAVALGALADYDRYRDR